MKKLLFRKLLFDYLNFFIISLFSVGIIVWVFQSVNYLDIMIEDGRDYYVYFKYSLLSFPKIISRIYPFALFFSIFYVTIRLENNNELFIFWNIGIQKIEIVNFIFKLSLILMIFQILLSALIVPKAQDIARASLKTSSVNFLGNFIKPQRFNDTIKGVTIFSEDKDDKGNLNNIYIKKETNNKNFQITYAKKGVLKEINKFPILVLFNGKKITVKDGKITNISFSKSDFPLKNIETNTTIYKKTQELSTLKLLKCINKIKFKKNIIDKIENCSEKNINNIFKEFYKRLVVPVYIPLLSLVPYLLIISSKVNSNFNRLKLITFIIGFVLIVFSETTIRLITEYFFNNLILSSIPIIFILILYIYFLKIFNLGKV